MSRRWTRALLKLYPSRVRRRYGDELLDLQDELRNDGEISAIRLIRDALAGAVIARSTRQRALILSGGALLAALIATGVTLHWGSVHPAGPPVAYITSRALHAQPATPYGQTCLVSSGTPCSLHPCSVFAVQSSTQTGAIRAAQTSSVRRVPRAKAVCLGASRNPHPHSLFVSDARPLTATRG